jgi:L-lactate utilization protein LutB
VESPVEKYWKIKLEDVKEALDANNFEAFVAQDVDEAKRIVLDDIIPKTGAKTVSWGGSMTFIATGLYEALKAGKDMEVLDTFDKRFSPQESLERRRQSLLVDLFLTGTNAVTESGMLVNLDMYGNRVAGITFGPKTVIILVGRNKIVADLDDALFRVKQYAAPANAMRLGKNTPCVKTANCEECKSSDRICNTWTITEKAYPAGRIKVVLINEDLGL